jgi:hypothetical protein
LNTDSLTSTPAYNLSHIQMKEPLYTSAIPPLATCSFFLWQSYYIYSASCWKRSLDDWSRSASCTGWSFF